MNTKALVVIDLQNDITKNYRDIIENVNAAIALALKNGLTVIYIKHNNVTAGAHTFKRGTRGAEFVPELKIASRNVFVKTKSSALTNEEFVAFIQKNKLDEFFIVGADATVCVKSTCFNLKKEGYEVHVLSDCVTSYDTDKIGEMLAYYESKGCDVVALADCGF